MFGFVNCVSVFVVVISRCKINYYFFLNDWVRLGHIFRLDGARRVRRSGFGVKKKKKKKTRLLNELGSGNKRGLVS